MQCGMHIVAIKKLSKEQIGEKIFVEKTIMDCSLSLRQRMPCSQALWKKLSQVATKLQNS